MNILIFKIAAAIVTFAFGLIGGLMSLRLRRQQNSSQVFSFGNSFSGGVFLGAGLLHLLPESIERLDHSVTGINFPLAYLVCAGGFVLTLFLEKALIFVNIYRNKDNKIRDNKNKENRIKDNKIRDNRIKDHKSVVYPYILTVILSGHSIIAGLALGTQQAVDFALIILIAIIAHKGSAGFALGVNLLKANLGPKSIKFILLTFSLMTPLGIFAGLLLSLDHELLGPKIVGGLFDALAAGTFIYISIVNIITVEFSVNSHRLRKFMYLCLGLLFMAVIAIWV